MEVDEDENYSTSTSTTKAKLSGKIRKLDTVVINKIAAGEVLQRPANALKELLENSLDAGASSIQVTVKAGGLKLLQIQDDGTGIRKEDLPILCERFTTSKLTTFDDLKTISTYGFRGEALASVSHVAHLTVITKTEDSPCAYKAEYSDGSLKKYPQNNSNPKPCAGNQGTTITVEDLFYNMDTRKRSLKSPQEEHSKVADVLLRYSIHNSNVGFSLKKFGENNLDIRTPSKSNVIDNVAILYGSAVSKELIPIACEEPKTMCKINGYISNINFSMKKSAFLLFINHRSVELMALKRSIDTVYGAYLPKGSYPFVYLSLEMNPQIVDVNVHPTKHEVHFLHEDTIIQTIAQKIENILLNSNQSRTFVVQSLLPSTSNGQSSFSTSATKVKRKERTSNTVYEKDMIRTDPKSQKIDKFLVPTNETPCGSKNSTSNINTSNNNDASSSPSPNVKKRVFRLTSLLKIVEAIDKDCHPELLDTFRNSTFVGCVNKTYSLIQHDTRLYLINNWKLSAELIYQKIIRQFGNMGKIIIKDKREIKELASFWYDLDDSVTGWREEEGSKEELCNKVQKILLGKASMLEDYFSLSIDPTGKLSSLPMVLNNYYPCMENLSKYLVDLAFLVNWTDEQRCFEDFCYQTSIFYSVQPGDEKELKNEKTLNGHSWDWTIEHYIYPEIKKSLHPPKSLAEDKSVIQLADLPDLYKVFERC